MPKPFSFASLLLLASLASAQNYILKSIVIDEGGKRITSSNYICQLSIGQPIASNIIENSNYKVVLGFWHPPYGGGLSGIKEDEFQKIPSLPLLFSLYPCYPNPFKNQTVIRYSIPKETEVSLKVFNTAGKVVATLVNGKQKPGIYNLTWNIKGVAKSLLPNGIYFYRLETPEFIATRKMIKTE